jgi:hypothetical protein
MLKIPKYYQAQLFKKKELYLISNQLFTNLTNMINFSYLSPSNLIFIKLLFLNDINKNKFR